MSAVKAGGSGSGDASAARGMWRTKGVVEMSIEVVATLEVKSWVFGFGDRPKCSTRGRCATRTRQSWIVRLRGTSWSDRPRSPKGSA